MGWMSGALVRVGLGLCVLYGVTLVSMLFLQRHHDERWRDVGDFLEELTTTWYWPVRRWYHCWRKIKNYAIFLRNIAYAAEPVVAAMTSSGHKLPHTIARLASFR